MPPMSNTQNHALQDTQRYHDLLAHPDASSRLNAALALAERGDATGLPVLIDGLGHASHRVRLRHVVKAIVQLGDVDDNEARRNACYALSCLGPRAGEAAGALARLLLAPGLRETAAEAMAKIGDASIPFLAATLDDPDVAVQSVARYALRKINSPDAADARGAQICTRLRTFLSQSATGCAHRGEDSSL